ncbi:hypothetical protein FA592_10075 [Sulfurospirillum diekertiae]|uniref:Uncharacterized protein n=1 Tax=Sulfurospirillum diekertiae TaxID=1854492 RepID=A0A6G9VUF6_9BACT|nr:hypothetical protein [Sulfurospirillum diekertiae]QIR76550.1 hypothetical protein FA584_10225 [Sulfurospirillum diekertiae]QIR79177.1 hypothetical protein FA592_10075 [Sulfurospirillum diekertiae]
MTISDAKNNLSQLFSSTQSVLKDDSASTTSSFAEEFQKQIATKTTMNQSAITEPSESDAMVEEFKKTLGSKGALTFFQDYNNEKIEKMIEEKKAELEDKLGLSADAQPPLTGNARAEALASLDQMLSDFRKQLMDKLNTDTKIDQQNSMLNTFLQKMG